MKKNIETKEEFSAYTTTVEETTPGYRKPLTFGICRVDLGQLNPEKVLQATYPLVNWNENFGSAAVIIQALIDSGIDIDFSESEIICDLSLKIMDNCLDAFTPYIDEAHGDKHKNIQIISTLRDILYRDFLEDELDVMEDIELEDQVSDFKICFIFDDTAVKSVEAAYLKLYALSQAKVELRSICLDGVFGALPNVAWSAGEPIELDYLREFEIELKLENKYPHIDFVDKFPRFLQHIIPADNTRILETSKVRFGAQLAAGTTVMPGASYINFNAGTLGAAMVEGRISSSAIVGKDSDVGGGASMLGVLSGTDGVPISLGNNSLLAANSVQGIPLGNETTLSAGVAIMDSTPVTIDPKYLEKLSERNPDLNLKETKTGKDIIDINRALIVEGADGVVIKWNNNPIKLNKDLH